MKTKKKQPKVWLGIKDRKHWSKYRWITYLLILADLLLIGVIVAITMMHDKSGKGIQYDGVSTTAIPTYLLGWVVLLSVAAVVVAGLRLRGSMRRVGAFIALCIILTAIPFAALLPYSNMWVQREYQYYHVESPDGDSTLVVEEWQRDLESGENFYILTDDTNSITRIGRGNGGEDGFPAFANGQYTVEWGDKEVTIHWAKSDGKEMTEGGTYKR